MRRSLQHSAMAPFLFILPALILVVGITYAGLGYTGWVSTLDWNGLDPEPKSAGFDNYVRIAGDAVFWRSLRNVAIFGVVTISVQMALGLVIAVLLSGNRVVARPFFKVLVFLPVVLAPAAVATAFREIMGPGGFLNSAIAFLGFNSEPILWLANPSIAIFSIAMINIWQWTGLSFLLYQAAIAQVDHHLFEAAMLDGAGSVKTFFYVLIPQLNGTHATLALLGWIGSLKTFDIVYMTTGGGPARTTEFLTTYIYRAVILDFQAGYSAALAVVLGALAILLTVIQIRLYRLAEN